MANTFKNEKSTGKNSKIYSFIKKVLSFVNGKKEPKRLTVPVSFQPGLTCPRCNFRIQISIPMLLTGQPIYCTQCFLELRIDEQKSNETISALKKLQSNFDKANEIIQQSRV